MATRVLSEHGWQRRSDGDVHDLLERMGAEIEQPARGEVAVAPRHPMSACPQGHPLPTLSTKWFDGVAWRDGREACRHCYEEGVAMD